MAPRFGRRRDELRPGKLGALCATSAGLWRPFPCVSRVGIPDDHGALWNRLWRVGEWAAVMCERRSSLRILRAPRGSRTSTPCTKICKAATRDRSARDVKPSRALADCRRVGPRAQFENRLSCQVARSGVARDGDGGCHQGGSDACDCDGGQVPIPPHVAGLIVCPRDVAEMREAPFRARRVQAQPSKSFVEDVGAIAAQTCHAEQDLFWLADRHCTSPSASEASGVRSTAGSGESSVV